MRAALNILWLTGAMLALGCTQEPDDANIVITNNMAGAEIEQLPADESVATTSGELANGAADVAPAAEDENSGNAY